jgi:hypothetical protein
MIEPCSPLRDVEARALLATRVVEGKSLLVTKVVDARVLQSLRPPMGKNKNLRIIQLELSLEFPMVVLHVDSVD